MKREFDFYIFKGDSLHAPRVFIFSQETHRGHAVFIENREIGSAPWNVFEMGEIGAKKVKRTTMLRRFGADFVKYVENSMSDIP
jgi:hypothetical protein